MWRSVAQVAGVCLLSSDDVAFSGPGDRCVRQRQRGGIRDVPRGSAAPLCCEQDVLITIFTAKYSTQKRNFSPQSTPHTYGLYRRVFEEPTTFSVATTRFVAMVCVMHIVKAPGQTRQYKVRNATILQTRHS